MKERHHAKKPSTNDIEANLSFQDAFDRLALDQRLPSRRHSSGSVFSAKGQVNFMADLNSIKEKSMKKSNRIGESFTKRGKSRESETRASSRNRDRHKQARSKRSNAVSSDNSDESIDRHTSKLGDPEEDSNVLQVRNRALIQENRRLQELVSDFERRFNMQHETIDANTSLHSENTKEGGRTTGDEDDEFDCDESISKLKGKIKSLKSKRKQEKLALLQLEKTVKAHSSEIESLQKELHRAVTEIETLESQRQQDKQKIMSLTAQISDTSHGVRTDMKDRVGKLKADLSKRDKELEVTLELLQSKVERIIQLECEAELGKEKLAKAERRLEEILKGSPGDVTSTSFQSIEVMAAEAEIKSLKRQNMMLKLVVEELQEAKKRRSDSDIDIDSVFQKLPAEFQQEHPYSVGLENHSLGGNDAHSVDASALSFDISENIFAAPLRPDPTHPFYRPPN
jgi:chromosome segregation ATPase